MSILMIIALQIDVMILLDWYWLLKVFISFFCVSVKSLIGTSLISSTERIKNSLNPDFTKVTELDYAFEEVQKLKFSVYILYTVLIY